MRRTISACLSVFLLLTPVAAAAQQGRETLGYGRIFNNDFLGDNKDRWRTGSNVVSKVVGYGWNGALPTRMGDIIEYRFRSEILAPDNLTSAAPGDRRYAGVLSFGLHTHFRTGQTEISLGGDMVITGPQTGVGSFHRELHKLFGASTPGVLGTQIGNGFHPTATAEIGQRFQIAPGLNVRPFIEVQAGAETLVRVGGDILIGRLGQDELFLRDVATGQRYRANRGAETGFSAVLGGDIAHVESSAYLPATSGFVLTDSRQRLRAGIHWQGEKASVFYGLTWMSEEFVAQPESQVVGSLRLNILF
jgi:hypothetical protein